MENVIFLFYKHFNTFKGTKRSTFFPSFIYENYIIPIDEHTFTMLLTEIDNIYNTGINTKGNTKVINLFDKIVASLSTVNVNEFE